MPNWCYNKLEITFSQEQSVALHNALFSPLESGQLCLDFNCLLPMPKELDIAANIDSRELYLLQQNYRKRLTYPVIKHCLRYNELEPIRQKAKQHRWTIGDFIHWLDKHPKEQENLHIDLTLGRQYLNNLNRYGYQDWYHWCLGNWGCKWNVYPDNCSIFEDTDSLVCCFDTAWLPPNIWFNHLCQQFPKVDFSLSFYEPGMWFAGVCQSNGIGGSYITEITDNNIRQFAKTVFGENFDDH